MKRKYKFITVLIVGATMLAPFFVKDIKKNILVKNNNDTIIENEIIPYTSNKIKRSYKNIDSKILKNNINKYCSNFFDVYSIDAKNNNYLEVSDTFLNQILISEDMWYNNENIFKKFESNKNLFYNENGLSIKFLNGGIQLINGLNSIDITNKKFKLNNFSWSTKKDNIMIKNTYGIIEQPKNNQNAKLYLIQTDNKNDLYITVMPCYISDEQIFYNFDIIDVKYGENKNLFKESIISITGASNENYKLVSLPELDKLFEEVEYYTDIQDPQKVDDILKRIAIEIASCHFEIPENDIETQKSVESSIKQMLANLNIEDEDGD